MNTQTDYQEGQETIMSNTQPNHQSKTYNFIDLSSSAQAQAYQNWRKEIITKHGYDFITELNRLLEILGQHGLIVSLTSTGEDCDFNISITNTPTDKTAIAFAKSVLLDLENDSLMQGYGIIGIVVSDLNYLIQNGDYHLFVDSLCYCIEEDYESRVCYEAFEHNYSYEYEYDFNGFILKR